MSERISIEQAIAALKAAAPEQLQPFTADLTALAEATRPQTREALAGADQVSLPPKNAEESREVQVELHGGLLYAAMKDGSRELIEGNSETLSMKMPIQFVKDKKTGKLKQIEGIHEGANLKELLAWAKENGFQVCDIERHRSWLSKLIFLSRIILFRLSYSNVIFVDKKSLHWVACISVKRVEEGASSHSYFYTYSGQGSPPAG